MTTFTSADHVTEQEPGPWRDCTIAALLETFRLALPDGRDIPATEAEKERFRAAAGLPDDHPGVTIDAMLPAARRLYSLTVDDYTITTEWAVAELALRNPSTVGVVTGMLGAVPAVLRRWDSFTGPHAVAARGHPLAPTWCDPLAPKGMYQGEPVTLATWRAFFTSLPGARALLMTAQGGASEMITTPAGLTSPQVARVVKAGGLLDAPRGKRIAGTVVGRLYPYIGTLPGHKAVLVTTALPYPDKLRRPTVLYVAADMVTIEDAPAGPVTSNPVTVTLTVNGKADFTRTYP